MRTVLAAALLVGACGTLSAAGAGAAASGGTRIVAAAPRLPHATRVLGAVRADASVAGAVVLRPRSEAALTRFIAAVTDKHSPLFHHYLAPGEFAARFGPAPSSIAAVTARLRSDGLQVTVAPNGMLVHFRGPAAQVEHAFGVGLDRIRLADGSIGRARTAPIRLPASLASLVTSVVGLDHVLRFRPAGIFRRATAHASRSYPAARTAAFTHPAGSPTPCAGAKNAASEFGGLTDDQIANAYGAFGLYGANDFGAGQRIAVFELEPFSTTDIHTFDTCYFGAAAATEMAGRLNTIPVDGGQPAGAGSGESLLDIENISALAPGATIDVYEAPNSTFGVLDEYAAIVNADIDHQARVVSSSWGLCEQAVQQGEPGVLEAESLLFQQAAAQGQSIFASAGDEGSNDCNAFFQGGPVTPILSQDDPASQPYVVGVGGTTIDNPTQPAAEHVWNDGVFWGAGGGGISESWPMPAWQLSSHVPGIADAATIASANSVEANDLGQPGYAFCLTDNPAGANQAACREVPDVSAQADEFTGGITVYDHSYGGWQTSGGTSSAAPIWAALLALANQSSTCQSGNPATANGVGFVSPLLYSVASNPTAYAASFNDVTAGNNDPYGFSGLFPATTGYDMATGLGSPQLTQPGGGSGLAYYLCTAAASGARPSVTGIAANVGFTSAPSTDVTITGTNFETGGTPDVAAVQVGDYVLPSSDFAVDSPTSISATFPAAAKVNPPQANTDGAGRVQVVVTLNDGESSAPSSGSVFTYVDNNGVNSVPAVTSVGPYGGADAGGNTVEIYGSGFTGATAVTFGNVAASTYTVLNDWEIAATVPAYSGATDCVEDGSYYGENATNDVCQTQVVVSNTHGSSTTATILPLYEGDASFSGLGVVPVPAGVEPAPASTEYDYFAPPTITSISTDGGPSSLASEEGDSVITITGTGLNLAGLKWVDFGDPGSADSQDFALVSVTGKEIEIAAPPRDTPTNDLWKVPVTVETLAGQSGSLDATYAGIPSVTEVTATVGPTIGHPAGPDTGGTPIEVKGAGFAGQLLGIAFVDAAGPFSIGTQYNFTANDNFELTSTTVAQNPGVVDVQVCTVTSCSEPDPSQDGFLLYPPGDPKIDSIAPAKGPASGGTLVTITGANLGCVTSVYFGKVAAEKVRNPEALLDCGSTTRVTVTAPPGTTGRSVRVTLTTAESDFTGFGRSKEKVMFRYTHGLKQLLTVKRLGTGRGTVTSSPAGVSCGSACHHRFPYMSRVRLTATPAYGSRFAGWSGACKGQGVCIVRMKSAQVVKARFIR